MDGRRPLLGDGVPRGDVGDVLSEAPCDVAVLVAREGDTGRCPAPTIRVLVPFGGAEHDWAALELGAWIASADRRAAEDARSRRATPTSHPESRGCSATPACSCSSTPASRPSRSWPSPARGRARGRRGRGPARDRPLGALAQRGPRPDALRDRARGAPPRSLFVRRGTRPGRAGAAGGRDPLHLVRRGNRPARSGRALVGRNLAKAAAVELVDEAAHAIAM